MSAAHTMEVLAALRALYTVCVGTKHAVEDKRPTEEQYQAALDGAEAVLTSAPAQLAIVDRVAFGVALRQNDLYACMAIAKRHDLAGWENETVIVGLDAAARGQDVAAAIEAHLHGEVTS